MISSDTLPPGWKKVTSKKQLWRFLYDNESLLVLRSHQNKWLCAEEDGVTITNNRQAIGPWEQFQIIVTSDGHLSLKTWKGKYLSCQPNGQLEANKKVAGPREKFEMFMFGDEKAALRSWSGTWLSARPDGRMEMNSHELGLWEMFYGCKEGSYDDWTPTPHNCK